MRLEKLLFEARERSVSISPDEAIEGIKAHCKSALADHKANKRVYRGIQGDGETFIIKPGEHERVSANTYNTYTLLIDNSKKWAKYPKRSKSIICSTALSTAEDYGTPYIVFPKDGFKFGVCPDSDMWRSFNHEIKTSLLDFNYKLEMFLRDSGIEFNLDYMRKLEDLELLCKKIDIHLQNTQERNYDRFKWIFEYDRYGNFRDLLESLFDPEDNDFKIVNDIGGMPSGEHEIWTDSDSYLVNYGWLYAGNNQRLIG